MKKLIVVVFSIVLGLSAIACGDASANKKEAMSYSGVKGYGWTAQKVNLYGDEVATAMQQAMTNNGFINSSDTGIFYTADATWNDDKNFVTICIKSEDIRLTTKSDRMMPAGCVNVSSKETGVEGAIGVALLPKAAEKLSLMLKNQIEGKAMPTQTTDTQAANTTKPVQAPAANTANANAKK